MAEGVLATLEKEFRPLLAPKLLADAKAVQVVWARVKGYPAWPAQILSEAAALRRKDLGQERHSKGNSVPVMFFGTVEVAWVKDADVVDFKEGLYQGFFDRKTKPFKLALEQVCEFLALDRKRKAPPKWWCKPPSNGHEEQSDGPAPKSASASGGAAAKGKGQQQDGAKASKQRAVTPDSESDSSSSDEEDAPAAQAAGKKSTGKPAGGKDSAAAAAKVKEPPAPAAKPRDSSNGRQRDSSTGRQRENGSTTASTSATALAQAKKPPPAPPVAPSRALPAPAGTSKDAKGAQAPQHQPGKPKGSSGTAAAPAKDADALLPPRKRMKVETPPPTATTGPATAGASSAPQLPPPAAKGSAAPLGGGAAGLLNSSRDDMDVFKLPAEIRRLAGIRLPANPKKPGAKVEESPRPNPTVKAEPAAASSAADRAVAASAPPTSNKREEDRAEVRAGRTTRASSRGGAQSAGARSGGSGQGKRSRRSRSVGSDVGASSSSASEADDDEEDEDDEEAQSSGEEADSEAADSSSEGSDSSEESSEDETVAAAEREGGNRSGSAEARKRLARRQRQPQPARDRRGEKQRRLARLSAPEPADRRTSSRLVRTADKVTPVAKKEESSSGDSDDEDDSDQQDRKGATESSASSSSSSGSDSEAVAETKKASGDGGASRRTRSSTRSPGAPRTRQERQAAGAAARKPPAGPPSRQTSQAPDPVCKTQITGSAVDGGAAGVEDAKKPEPSGRAEGSAVASVAASGATVAATVAKAVPLELRRLQNSPSEGPPVVDMTEPRTLRDRSSPARRLVSSAGVTPTQTQTGVAATASVKRGDKRSSDDDSGASMSPATEPAEQTRSFDHLRDGGKGSAASEAKPGLTAGRAQSQEGRGNQPTSGGSCGGSASPPPGPLTGGVPVRKKPPSLGVPSGGRQLPAIVPARPVLRSLTSKRDMLPPPAAPIGVGASTSAAGAVAPAAMCVPRKPSSGPPTRHLVDRIADAPVSSTDLPDSASVDGEADGKHASSPDVAAAAAGDGQMPRSPEAVPAAESQRASLDGPPGEALDEGRGDAPMELLPPSSPSVLQLRRKDREVEGSQTRASDEGMPQQQASDQVHAAQHEAAKMDDKQAHACEGAQTADVDMPLALQPETEAAGCADQQGDSGDSHGAQQEPRPDAVDPDPAPLAPQQLNSAAGVEEQMQARRSPACSQQQQQQPASSGQEVQQRPCSRLLSPVREDVLLAEEQLPDAADDKPAIPPGLEVHHPTPCGVVASAAAMEPACARQASRDLSADNTVVLRAALESASVAAVHPQLHGASADGSGVRGGDGTGASCSTAIAGEYDGDEAARARARELEELGEVAAALAGLQRAQVVPRLPPLRQTPSAGAPLPPAGVVELPLDRTRNRSSRGSAASGRDTSGGSREAATGPAPLAASPHGFRWPQPEPILPAQDQPFALPREWLITRPPRYEPIRRNMWLSRNKPKRLPKDEVSICACRPPPVAAPGDLQRMGCGLNCLNRLSSILCDPKLCPCGELCSNRSLHLLRPPKSEAFLTENRGWGVRAVEPVPKGGFIIEYAGEIIDERELGRRMEHARMNGEPHFYIMELSAGLYIDARRRGNAARLINSSCDPNCETQKWHDAATGEVRVGIFATRDIMPGEELVYDYFFSTYGALKPSAASFICMCGAKNCRGTMDLHPEKRRDLGRRVEVFWDADGQFYRAVVVAYHPTSRKHTVMYEDGGTEKLCLDEVPHRWLDEDQSRTSPSSKRNSMRGDNVTAADPAGTAAPPLQQQQPQLPQQLVPPPQPQQDLLRASSEPPQQLPHHHQQQPATAISADLGSLAARAERGPSYSAGVAFPAVVTQPPPRAMATTEQRFSLPPLGSAAAEAGGASAGGQAGGKHGLSDGEMHLPLKKRPRMMTQQHPAQQNQQQPTLLDRLGSSAGGSEAHAGLAQPQGSGGSGTVLAAAGPGSGPSVAADSGAGDMPGLGNGGRSGSSSRQELSGAGSGRNSGAVADDDTNEDLTSLLEAAEAVAALRTAPIGPAVSLPTPQDSVLPLQPRNIRSGGGGGGPMSMVQATKVASPRHFAGMHRSAPPNGLPPHSSGGGAYSRAGNPLANPLAGSSSAGIQSYHAGGRQQHQHYSPQLHMQQDAGFGQEQQQLPLARTRRHSAEVETGTGIGSGATTNGGINREDLLWRLVGIEKPKDLLPLFAGGGDKGRNGAAGNKNGRGSGSWIAPTHPYGKLLRALESSELLPHADQLRLYAQQHQHQQQAQQHYVQPQPQPQALPQPPPQQQQPLPPQPQQPLPQPLAAQQQPQQQQSLHQQAHPHQQTLAAATTAEALALSAWQHAAQQHLQQQQQHHHPHPQQQHIAHHALHTAAQGASYLNHGLDGSAANVAALLQAQAQQQHAAAAAAAASAAAAMAAASNSLHLHAAHASSHAGHAAAAAAAAAGRQSQALAQAQPQQQQGTHSLAATAAQWQQAAVAAAAAAPGQQHGQILQDLVHMYIAQHAGPHQVLALAGTATAGGPQR